METLCARVPVNSTSAEKFAGLQCRVQAGASVNSRVVFDVNLNEEHVYVMVDEDLVKSHLLLAVREEVDVLNANISQLVERIGRLERENAQLRNFVPAEVLARVDNKHPSARGVSRQ